MKKPHPLTAKKIVIVTDSWTNNISGVVTSLLHTKKGLEKKGFEVSIIHPELFRNAPLPFYSEIRMAILPKRKFERILKQKKPDYIHIATEGTLGLSARGICVKNNWKFTTSYHTRMPEYVSIRVRPLKGATYKYLRWFHSKSQKTTVSTPSLKKELESKSFKNVICFPLGVDLKLFKKNPKAKIPDKLVKAGLKKPVFTFLGRVAPEKNIETFLKCDLPGSKLVIGDGPQRKDLEKEFKGSAVFVGRKKATEVADLLSISDVFVFPSKTDTFGLAIIEALACGVPVAAYNVQGPKNIITNGVDGFLGGSLKANALKCLNIDRKNCRKTAMKYSWDNFTDEFIKNLVHI